MTCLALKHHRHKRNPVNKNYIVSIQLFYLIIGETIVRVYQIKALKFIKNGVQLGFVNNLVFQSDKWLDNTYGKYKKIKVKREKNHDYLEMNLIFGEK